uniref:Uncharacterized protein n=1 Tax=Eutreptiella gymnastica TaxID=73025 RepID=A0A7S1NLI5_9EUGL
MATLLACCRRWNAKEANNDGMGAIPIQKICASSSYRGAHPGWSGVMHVECSFTQMLWLAQQSAWTQASSSPSHAMAIPFGTGHCRLGVVVRAPLSFYVQARGCC